MNYKHNEQEKTYEYNGNIYSEDDFFENYFICEKCENAYPRDDEICCEDTDRSYCPECAEKKGIQQCDVCGEYHFIGNMHFTRDTERYFCESCSDDLHCCYGCGEYFEYDDSGDYDDWDDWYCTRCRTPRVIASYHTMKDTNNYEFRSLSEETADNKYPLYMGFELEVDKGSDRDGCAQELKDHFGTFYCYERDGSLDTGFEIISNPATLGYHLQNDFDFLKTACAKYGFKSHDAKTCGFHIHIDKKYFGEGTALDCATAKLLFLFERHWDNLYKFSRRRDCHWCEKYNVSAKKVLEDSKKHRLDRYYAINLTNRKTIEIRLWRGTLNATTFRATLKLTQRICDIAKNMNAVDIAKLTFADILGDDPDILEYWASRSSESAQD